MKDQLISFETAKLAKEKGFTEYCDRIYTLDKSGNYSEFHNYDDLNDNEYYYAPTQSLLQKYIREIHNIHISITIKSDTYSYKFGYIDFISIEDDIKLNKLNDDIEYKTYIGKTKLSTHEKALELALKTILNIL